jgi:mono/diheme cytochrome c family protein
MTPLLPLRVAGFAASLVLAGSVAASAADAPKGPVTFAKDVAPIFQEKCQTCHRPGEVAPMSLLTYQDARPWARAIKEKVQSRLMPPWHIDSTVGIQSFKNDIRLSQDQIDTIVRWVDTGATMGDPKDLPPAKVFDTNNEWKLAAQFGQREPDLIIRAWKRGRRTSGGNPSPIWV